MEVVFEDYQKKLYAAITKAVKFCGIKQTEAHQISLSITQMIEKGYITMFDLRQLIERLPIATNSMITSINRCYQNQLPLFNKLSSNKVLPIFADLLDEDLDSFTHSKRMPLIHL